MKLEVCTGLTKPVTIGGIPREFAIINGMFGLIFAISLANLWMASIFIFTHLIMMWISKKDKLILIIFFKKYMHQKNYYYEG